MGTIAITVTRTGAPYPLTKTYTVADADIDKIVTAYQDDANVIVNGTATKAQVWLYIAGTWADAIKAKVKSFNTVPAVIPPDISVT